MVKIAAMLMVAMAATVQATWYTDVWLSVREYQGGTLSSPTFCPSWFYPNTAEFYNVSVGAGQYINLNGTNSYVPWTSVAEATAGQTEQIPQEHFYFQVGACVSGYISSDPVGTGTLFGQLGSFYQLTYDGSANYQFLYQCDPTCTMCSLNASFPVGPTACNVNTQAKNATVAALGISFQVLLSIPRPPVNDTTLLAGISYNSAVPAESWLFLGGSAVTPVTAVYAGTAGCDNVPSYYRVGFETYTSSTASVGVDCYPPGVPTNLYYSTICLQGSAATAPQLFINGFGPSAGAGYSSCNLGNQSVQEALAYAAGTGAGAASVNAAVGGIATNTQPSFLLTPAVPATRNGTTVGARQCTASGCISPYLLSSITVCSGDITSATYFTSSSAAASVTCPVTPAPTTLTPTTVLGATTVAPSAAASLTASLAMFAAIVLAVMAL